MVINRQNIKISNKIVTNVTKKNDSKKIVLKTCCCNILYINILNPKRTKYDFFSKISKIFFFAKHNIYIYIRENRFCSFFNKKYNLNKKNLYL